MAVRPAYGFPVRRQAPVSAGLSSSFSAILENRKLQKEAGTQVDTKAVKIANDAKKAGVSVAPSSVVSAPIVAAPVVASAPQAPSVVSIPAAGISVSVPAPVVPTVASEAPSK